MLYRIVAIVSVLAVSVSCRSATPDQAPELIQPGAPGQSGKVVTAAKAADLSQVQATLADVKFMQGMIGHHAQALEMAALLSERSASEDMKLLAKRIEVSQADEIKMMQDWLQHRGQSLPDPHAHHAPGAPLMPGMLTAEEMGKLAAAQGTEFDRLFLQFMIKHHAGALQMVQELFASPGAGQEADIFAFASDVDADQRMEIDRMDAMLAMRKEQQ